MTVHYLFIWQLGSGGFRQNIWFSPYLVLFYCFWLSLKRKNDISVHVTGWLLLFIIFLVLVTKTLSQTLLKLNHSTICAAVTAQINRPSDESSYGLRSTESTGLVKESWKWLPTWIPQKQLKRAVLVMTCLRLRYFETVLSLCSQSLPQTSFSVATLVTGLSECAEFWLGASSEFFFLLSQKQAHPVTVSKMQSLSKVWLDSKLNCWTSCPRCY